MAGGAGLIRKVALSGAGLLLAAVVLAPYAVMLLTALKPAAELRVTPPRLLPHQWRPQNFWTVLRDPEFQSWLTVSLVVALVSTLLVLVAAVPAAYHTARHRFRGRGAFLFLVLVTQMFAPTALVVGLYREFFELGLINTYTALIAVNAAFNLAFAVWILRAFFASIPREIEEAAAVDGCGRAGVLLRVVLPVAAPPDRRHHLLRHRLRPALGPALRRLGDRDRPGGRALRPDRALPGGRPHRGQRQVAISGGRGRRPP